MKQEEFLQETPHPQSPWFICAWIMNNCDELQLKNNNKASTTICGTYAHAQKMWASMTYIFSCIYGLRSLPWHKNETTRKMVGNPSVSQTISSYMLSLRHQKVQSGETTMSAHAITPVS
ncbi:hypothetical protein L208DRAFT_1238763 [Tricholoma matsutake]|nr:hypothetical protein L208DRAFT_1238763 [Tricholoma matsutake 945]